MAGAKTETKTKTEIKTRKKARKAFQDLEFQDAFMFAATLEDEELCRKTLERILGISIERVVVRAENTLFVNSDYHGIRMDVYARDEAGTVYNVEMQTTQQPADMLPKRSRYYQSQLDLVLLKPGEDFRNLPNSFVIFICTFDPFGRKSYRYTFLEQCQENGALLNDGSAKIFLNCEGENVDEESREVQDFLRYVKESLLMRRTGDPALVEDELLAGLETRMRELKKNRGLEDRYMLFEEMLAGERREGYEDGRAEGLTEGHAAGLTEGHAAGLTEGHAAGLTEGHAAGLTEGLTTGQDRMLALITAMTAAGEGREVPKLSDEGFRKVMYEKYKIV